VQGKGGETKSKGLIKTPHEELRGKKERERGGKGGVAELSTRRLMTTARRKKFLFTTGQEKGKRQGGLVKTTLVCSSSKKTASNMGSCSFREIEGKKRGGSGQRETEIEGAGTAGGEESGGT